MLRRAFCIVVTVGVLGVASAQMQDVPLGHWAYQSIEQLIQLGILEGYPDGTFRPNQPMTRAEFAQAIARAYRSLEERIRALERRLETVVGREQPAQPPDLTPLRRQIDELRAQLQELQKLNEAVQTLQRLFANFQQELEGLKPEVGSLKQELDALRRRIEALEGGREGVKVRGDLTFGGFTTHGLERNRRAFTLNNSLTNPTGNFLQGIQIAHELGITIEAQMNETTSGRAIFVLGTYLPYSRGAVKTSYFLPRFVGVGRPPFAVAETDFVVWEAFVRTSTRLLGTDGELVIGRFPIVLTPYTIRRGPPEFYLFFDRYRDLQYRFDGVMLTLKQEAFQLRLIAAQFDGQLRANSALYMTPAITNHNSFLDTLNGTVQQLAGVRAEVNALRNPDRKLTLAATYLATGTGRGRNFVHMQRVGTTYVEGIAAGNIDRIDIFGADLQAQFGRLRLNAEYSQADYIRGDTRVLKRDNWALDTSLVYEVNNTLTVSAGYREIRPYYASLGSWGRIGYLFRPSDFRGPTASVRYTVSPALRLSLSGEFYEGTGKSNYRTDDDFTRVVFEATYRLNERTNLTASYEGVFWDVSAATSGLGRRVKPVWNYYTLQLNYALGNNTSLILLYQLIDTDGKGLLLLSGGDSPNKNSGAALGTSLSIKF